MLRVYRIFWVRSAVASVYFADKIKGGENMAESATHNYKYEIVTPDSNIPGKVELYEKPAPQCFTNKHWHKSIEMIYVLKGTLWVLDNGLDRDISDGEYVVINSEGIHQTCGKYPDKTVKYLVVQFSYGNIRNYFPAVDEYSFDVNKSEQAKIRIGELLKAIAVDTENASEFCDLKISCAMLQILTLLFMRCREKRPDRPQQSRGIDFEYARKAIAFIRENYKNKITLEDIASYVGLTPTYFSRYFKQTTRKNFKQYLGLVRLENALNDMQTKGIGETKASLDNGFASVKAFIETFKSVYKCTPSEYAKIHHEMPSISEIRRI